MFKTAIFALAIASLPRGQMTTISQTKFPADGDVVYAALAMAAWDDSSIPDCGPPTTISATASITMYRPGVILPRITGLTSAASIVGATGGTTSYKVAVFSGSASSNVTIDIQVAKDMVITSGRAEQYMAVLGSTISESCTILQGSTYSCDVKATFTDTGKSPAVTSTPQYHWTFTAPTPYYVPITAGFEKLSAGANATSSKKSAASKAHPTASQGGQWILIICSLLAGLAASCALFL